MMTPTLTIPFEALVSDNAKYGVMGGRMILTKPYRHAKDTIAALAALQWRAKGVGKLEPLSGRLQLHATLYEPNADKERDPGNYRKCVTDALQGVTYHRDSQLSREVWERGTVDPKNPRLTLTLTEV